MDQIFVALKQWLVQLAPAPWQPVLSGLISVAAIIGTFATLFALTTLLERKGLARMQNRYGPNRVGPTWMPSYAWFFGKLLALIGLFIWVRGTLPRLRMDQLMNFAWKFML